MFNNYKSFDNVKTLLFSCQFEKMNAIFLYMKNIYVKQNCYCPHANAL